MLLTKIKTEKYSYCVQKVRHERLHSFSFIFCLIFVLQPKLCSQLCTVCYLHLDKLKLFCNTCSSLIYLCIFKNMCNAFALAAQQGTFINKYSSSTGKGCIYILLRFLLRQLIENMIIIIALLVPST